MHVVVVASGELRDAAPSAPETVSSWLSAAHLLVAADGGLVHCAARGIWPHVLVGDLDSAPPALVAEARDRGVEVVAHPSDKDATDLELAIELSEARGASRVTVLGLFGGRVDHELANVALLASARWGPIGMSGGDGLRTVWVVAERTGPLGLAERPGTPVTLLPWNGDVERVTTAGLRWPLDGERLVAGSTRGVSNVCVEPHQRVSVGSGTLLVVVDRAGPGATPRPLPAAVDDGEPPVVDLDDP